MIPSRKFVFDLIKETNMPYHIILHSLMVRQVAVAITYRLVGAGKHIDVNLVDRAALLHDISKMDSIIRGGDHALMGERLLMEHGYPLVGSIVGQHVRVENMVLDEAMVVNYADKRVKHDRVVTLEQRFVDIMERYGKDEERIKRILNIYDIAKDEEHMIMEESGLNPLWLINLNLIPGYYTLYAEYSLLGKYALAEAKDEYINSEGVDHNQAVLSHE